MAMVDFPHYGDWANALLMVSNKPSFASYRHTGRSQILLLSAMQAAVTAGERGVIDAASLQAHCSPQLPRDNGWHLS